MRTRKRCLPGGWYPSDPGEADDVIQAWHIPEGPKNAMAGVAPHAAWYYCGELACRVFARLDSRTETVAVVGGHLSRGDGVLAAKEDAFETPWGALAGDMEFLEDLLASGGVPFREDRWPDNTVEILVPFVKLYLPDARLLWLRAEPSDTAIRLGEALASTAARLGRKLAVVGSTDLTHYGSDRFGFAPKGTGPAAATWVRETNDKRVLEAMTSLRLSDIHKLATAEQSACSSGGAVAAASYAARKGSAAGELLGYATSRDQTGEDEGDFVGYGAVVYAEA